MTCPPHPILGLACTRDGDHELCVAPTPHPGSYAAAWVRVWWRDGHVTPRPRLHAGPYDPGALVGYLDFDR